ncbi:hypothetical protein OTB20_40815 [Streptomyces sp. H27-H1]|uniref:hypothetical protein n=1 Tax=Streptomyces sp. H27-H1 TaxID=2996461 RepID=UPI002270FFAC|nr:hypothetical protein [Streptomyces sp. H27-H1]MCY0932384.1 hypothetical protein [Streptomyces sp. H27-H1]
MNIGKSFKIALGISVAFLTLSAGTAQADSGGNVINGDITQVSFGGNQNVDIAQSHSAPPGAGGVNAPAPSPGTSTIVSAEFIIHGFACNTNFQNCDPVTINLPSSCPYWTGRPPVLTKTGSGDYIKTGTGFLQSPAGSGTSQMPDQVVVAVGNHNDTTNHGTVSVECTAGPPDSLTATSASVNGSNTAELISTSGRLFTGRIHLPETGTPPGTNNSMLLDKPYRILTGADELIGDTVIDPQNVEVTVNAWDGVGVFTGMVIAGDFVSPT